MKQLCLLTLLFVSVTTLAQQSDSSEAKLFLPANVLKGLPVNQKLLVYMIAEKTESKPIEAKKIRDNVYRFPFKREFYYRIIFVAGEYCFTVSCIDNKNGSANEDYVFEVLLEKRKFDPIELKFIAPCIVKDEE
jgi:hypothetical protein